MGRLHLLLAAALAAPLVLAHPHDIGNGTSFEAHMVDAGSGQRHHAEDGALDPLRTNRSYWLEVALKKHGNPVEGRIGVRYNGTERWAETAQGVALFPIGNPPEGSFTVRVHPVPQGWVASSWEATSWIALPGDGAREAEPLHRFAARSLPQWRTYEATVEQPGYARLQVGWDYVAGSPGGFLWLLGWVLPDGTVGGRYGWAASDGTTLVRIHVAALGQEASATPFTHLSTAFNPQSYWVEGTWPAGTVFTVTQGALHPNFPDTFRFEVESDLGVLAVRETARGPMEAHGGDEFDGGLQTTATVAGVGYSSRGGREARFTLPGNGTVLLQAIAGPSPGTYAWRFAGEEVTARISARSWYWELTGTCGGEWWMRADAASFRDESFTLLHLGNHTFPPFLSWRHTQPTGNPPTGCLRAP